MSKLEAPFPWFGGKKLIADIVWQGLGDVQNYIEPFFGSGAVLLNRPHPAKRDIVNDKDGLLSNFWRSIAYDPEATAHHANWPKNEADLHARHLWLVGQRDSLTDRLMGDPQFYDAQAAGWWVWGASCWIGSGWCSGEGLWVSIDGVFQKGDGGGVQRNLPNMSRGGGVQRNLPNMSHGRGEFLADWFTDLSKRFETVEVACGEWTRVTGPSVIAGNGGVSGVFLDPPYCANMRESVYAVETIVGESVRKWCLENGDNPMIRIALAGYDGEHNELEANGWRVHAWKANGGYGSQSDVRGRDNAAKERIWFSPHCIEAARDLFS